MDARVSHGLVAHGRQFQLNLVIILAVVCAVSLVWAIWEWDRSRGRDAEALPDLNGWREALLGLCLTLAWFGSLWVLADANGWSRDRTLWLGGGSFIAVMTVVRPRWYWNNHRARWLRNSVGDTATAAFYLLVAVLMIWAGLFTNWTFGRR